MEEEIPPATRGGVQGQGVEVQRLGKLLPSSRQRLGLHSRKKKHTAVRVKVKVLRINNMGVSLFIQFVWLCFFFYAFE